ncbi:MAG: Asp-tRNA(Asn)/Glu-tRNA(Gln) amidotransferase subunit GatB [Actinomycetota bacterium]|nr:Asp-tRNA(Asn)/Glu-tRNA(Gln) amidotransferase subunit GatB [Actinomycetota bacterium]MEC9474108.1 Asp-tRNA(Asn)/Glu-tRNA(Gln) amidotransferase subunit GatB [Actinomycetota bacterium]MED5361309.1 Asp-tRNA(Asn)/Glu-tRNA(Gln) amidotransferase subunit GatB [Actinomycetota bacterium]|tara:strand:- start:275 stop:1681 length:1407 start_codon:yes stop_codon:yes gene_type:complete
MSEWETVVGLEVHVELATKTKLFSHAPNRFGDAPNTNITPVCLGLPGSLPVLNRRAVELAMTVGLALGCDIRPSVFHRKNYFYPDMPKDYQVSQYDRPICVDGSLNLPNGTRIGIERAHLEEDAGKTTHLGGEDGRIHGADQALVDYNRAGVPLLEIVSQPDIRSAEDARAYVEELRAILIAVQASEARLEEGSMRVDANVSVRPAGSQELRTRCEIKNLNSLRSLQRAVSYEAQRHIGLYEAGAEPSQETRHWSEDGRTHTLRSKEEANDYRYFPEPDLVLLNPDAAWIKEIADTMPELPAQKRDRLIDVASVDLETAATIVNRGMSQLLISAVDEGADPRRAVTHIIQNLAIDGADELDPTHFVELVQMEESGDLTATQTKQVLGEMVTTGLDPGSIAQNLGFESMESEQLDALVDAAIEENSEAWEKFCEGEDKVQGVFVGAVMKASKGQADGKAVAAILKQRRG